MKVLRCLFAVLLVGLFASVAQSQTVPTPTISQDFATLLLGQPNANAPLGSTDYLAISQGDGTHNVTRKFPGSNFLTLADIQSLLNKTIDCTHNTCLNFPGGGTVTWPSTHYVIISNSSNTPSSASPSTSGFVLTSNGASADPTFQAPVGGSATTTMGVTAGTPPGTVLTTDWATVSTVGAGQAVQQETPVNGTPQMIANNGANPLLVYPVTGGSFDQSSANTPLTPVAPGARVILYCFSTTYCVSK
jgi:hypothetical protein